TVSIDEASSDTNSNDRAAAVVFTPGAFAERPTVVLGNSVAGAEGAANLSFTTTNPLPADGHVMIKFPSNFTAINSSDARASGIDGGLVVSVGADGFTVDVRRDGSGTEVGSGVNVSVTLLDGVVNEQFEGPSDEFPMVKTTLAETDVSIDEASADFHGADRPAAAWFTPGAFTVRPRVTLDSYIAGAEGAANINFTISNPLPIDGHVVIEFPSTFTSINFTEVTAAGIDGGFNASVGGDGYTVDIHRDGTGTEVAAGTNITVTVVDGVKNQLFEGSSDVFPVVKTTLKDSTVSIDEASSDTNSNDRAAAVVFTPGAFAERPTVVLGNSVAGVEGAANLSFTTTNPLPADGHVMIKFPSNFTAINSSDARASGIDGGLVVSVGADGFTVDVRRDGSGTEVGSGVNVSVTLLDGVVNEQFEGPSDEFPMVKTTLAETDVSIDEASADFHGADRPAAAWFTPGAFAVRPRVTLDSYIAGAEGSANINFTISNPLPIDGHVVIEFPSTFTSINFTEVTAAGIDGGFNASVGGDGYTVDIHRDGAGTEVAAGTNITVTVVDGVKNQLFEGSSDVFPVVKTTLKDSTVSIDEASSDTNSNDRAAAVVFTPGAFAERPTVVLGNSVAGVEGAANLSFTTTNPLPADGHVMIKFPSNFTAINSSDARASGIDGGLVVSVGADGFTVDVRRDGSGTEVGSGVNVSVTLL
ncbi:unnamed protein product, partial [Laminaria digitata]